MCDKYFQASPVCPTFGLADKKPWCSLLWYWQEVQTTCAPVHRWASSPQPHCLVTIKARQVSSPLSSHFPICFGVCLTRPRSPHYVRSKTFLYPLRHCVGSSVLTSRTNLGWDDHSILSPKFQSIPQQILDSLQLGLRIS